MHMTSPATFTIRPNAKGRKAPVALNNQMRFANPTANMTLASGYAHSASIQRPKMTPAKNMSPIRIMTSSAV